MGCCIDMAGERYGKLVVSHRDGVTKTGTARWACVCDCGNKSTVARNNLLSGNVKSCGCHRKAVMAPGPANFNWRGGRTTNRGGYVLLRDRTHPNASKNGQVFEHVKVMAAHLKRPIAKGETVHHKNGKKDDNRIENLELWMGSHGAGQRLTDMQAECYKIFGGDIEYMVA